MTEKKDTERKILEVLVIVLGIGLLVLTFSTAYSMFTNPSALEGYDELTPEGEIEITMGGNTANVSEPVKPALRTVSYVIGGLLLWVMGSIAGRIIKHGASMYKS